MDFVKIYGERNTGTNYLTALLAHNVDIHLLPGVVPRPVSRLARPLNRIGDSPLYPLGEHLKDRWFRSTFNQNLGWKHMLVSAQDLAATEVANQTLFVGLVKNPYSWALSLYRRPYHQRGARAETLEDFLQTPWRTVGREMAPAYFSNPIEMWNEKCSALSRLTSSFPTQPIRYEDLLASPDKVVEQIRRRAGAPSISIVFRNVEASTKKQSHKDYDYYVDYYLNMRWRDSLSKRAVDIINRSLDTATAAELRYEMIDRP